MQVVWVVIAAVVLPVSLVLFLVLIWFCRRLSKRRDRETARITHTDSLQNGIAQLHLANPTKNHKNLAGLHHELEKKNKSYFVLQRELSMKPHFNWADNPALVSEAVEYGWSRFAFHGQNISSASTRSKLLGLCISVDQVRESGAEISWEVSLESAEFMQKVRLNSRLKRAILGTSTPPPLGVSCATQTALPLPGPFLGNSSFPQEAYFEITVLSSRGDGGGGGVRSKVKVRKGEGENIKLIQEDVAVDTQSEELRIPVKEEGRWEPVAVSVGFSVGGSHPRRLPGSYFGSIGFNSDGSVYLDGIKLVHETEKAEWGSTDRIIGCGFDPNQKKVFFTVDSELVHVIDCKSDEFGRPLYPTLAANTDVTVLVNFGQSPFKYAPANVHRTPNPCFIASLSNNGSAALGYEDSKELFSMGRIDAEWLNRSTTRSSHSAYTMDSTKIDIDEESETDFYEIVLDKMKSPKTFS